MRPSHVKRFMELYQGDPDFRSGVEGEDPGVVERWRLEVDARALRPLWERGASDGAMHAAVLEYRARRESLRRQGRSATADLGRLDSSFGRWRLRQVHRSLTQSSPPLWANPHYPFAIELARGCSIGCDYCCFDAPPVTAVSRYSHQNARLFDEVLGSLAALLGDGVG